MTLLDDLAVGLRTVLTAAHGFRNWIDGLPTALRWKVTQASPFQPINDLTRQACYTLGVVANQLILPSRHERDEQERKRATAEEGKEKRQSVDFAKLDMLQGGIERCFIPELSESSKQLIGSFFKITMDEELSEIAKKKPEQVKYGEED